MYKAVLDTCVLVPDLQRDFLLQLATEHAYAALWGTGILFELDYVLEGLNAGRGVPQEESDRRRTHLFEQMAYAFPGSTVNAPKDRDYDYQLHDPNDGHVAHAAIIGKADAIVTNDGRAGFPTAPALLDADVETLSAAEFAANTVAAHPAAGIRALEALAARRSTTPQAVLDDLRDRHEMNDVAAILGSYLDDV